jgi:hypothetical protein
MKTGDHFQARVKGQGQGLTPGPFKLWVNCIRLVQPPHRGVDQQEEHAAQRVFHQRFVFGRQRSLGGAVEVQSQLGDRPVQD